MSISNSQTSAVMDYQRSLCHRLISASAHKYQMRYPYTAPKGGSLLDDWDKVLLAMQDRGPQESLQQIVKRALPDGPPVTLATVNAPQELARAVTLLLLEWDAAVSVAAAYAKVVERSDIFRGGLGDKPRWNVLLRGREAGPDVGAMARALGGDGSGHIGEFYCDKLPWEVK